ncbi:MAG TPA: hypothetical protein DCK98_17160 [Chloroflexi bacterium]|jgi:uncharacterized protein (DUF885 family)|nr:hypothetical protein [Chloroflexota bacterium]HAL26806.1 hypothetical protein [Chloroflexota bacterium]
MVGEQSAFRQQVEAFVRDRYALDPTAATIAGLHDHDARLADLSDEGFAARDAFTDRWLHVFESHDPASWAAPDRTDLALVLGELRGEKALRPFERQARQPSLYSDAITRGAYYALIREEGDVETRFDALAERLEQAPAALRHAVANLDPDRVPPVYVVVAGESATAGATFVRAILPSLAPQGSKAKAALTGAGKRAGDALDQYASWLRDDLMRRAKGSFAIGRDAFDALLRDRELLPYDSTSLQKWGEELYAETAAKLADAARALGDTEWRDSVDRLRKEHPSEDELVGAYRTEMERSRAATHVADLASFPAGESLTVESMPDFARPTLPYAAYVQPGPFERARRGRFWVTLPAPDEPETVKEERLSGHPRKGIAVIACHEGYPGHHLQLATAADHPSIARKAIRSNVLIEGWGLYVEELMTELGFLDDPETRLLRLKDLLWRAARVSVDVGLSTGELGFEQAVNFMLEGPKLERTAAVGECRRYTLNPLQPSSYALGRAAILDLRARARRKGFGMRAFHDALLGCASIPPALAAAELGL